MQRMRHMQRELRMRTRCASGASSGSNIGARGVEHAVVIGVVHAARHDGAEPAIARLDLARDAHGNHLVSWPGSRTLSWSSLNRIDGSEKLTRQRCDSCADGTNEPETERGAWCGSRTS
jgi:hypothetical protein